MYIIPPPALDDKHRSVGIDHALEIVSWRRSDDFQPEYFEAVLQHGEQIHYHRLVAIDQRRRTRAALRAIDPVGRGVNYLHYITGIRANQQDTGYADDLEHQYEDWVCLLTYRLYEQIKKHQS